MAQDLIIPTQIQKPQTENVGFTLRKMSLEMPTPTTAGTISLQLEAKDADGNWRTDVAPVIVHRVDDLESLDPRQRAAASAFLDWMFTANISDTPTHRAQGVANVPVWDAAKGELNAELKPNA